MACSWTESDANAYGRPVAGGGSLWSFTWLLPSVSSLCSDVSRPWWHLALGGTRRCFAKRRLQPRLPQHQLWRYIAELQPYIAFVQPKLAELFAHVAERL